MGLLKDVVLDKLVELLAVCCKDFISMSTEVCLREVPGVFVNSVEFACSKFQEEIEHRDLQMLFKLSLEFQEHFINKFFVVLDIRQVVIQ